MSNTVTVTKELDVEICIYSVQDSDRNELDFTSRVDDDGDLLITVTPENSEPYVDSLLAQIEDLEAEAEILRDRISELEEDV